jgi:hypothetical protein
VFSFCGLDEHGKDIEGSEFKALNIFIHLITKIHMTTVITKNFCLQISKLVIGYANGMNIKTIYNN